MNELKICAFADLHEAAGYYNQASARLTEILKSADAHHVDMVLHCGDLCHGPTLTPEIVEQCDAYTKPVLHCVGNHECDGSSFQEVITAYHMPDGHYYRDIGGFRFICYDVNQMIHRGKLYHYEQRNYWHPPQGIREPDTQMDVLGPEQIRWMEQSIMDSPYPCVLFGHHSLIRTRDGLCTAEREQVRAMLRRVNNDRQRILLVLCGHYHVDYLNFVDNVPFFELNSASNYWFNKPHDRFPEEILRTYPAAANTIIWNDPLHAIITLREDGYVHIRGMRSDYYCGVSMESLGLPRLDPDGRPVTPEVLTTAFRLDMSGLHTLEQ